MDKIILNKLQDIEILLKTFITKDDAKNFTTKDDLKNFATKDDLKNFATKDDLSALEIRLTNKISDLDQMQMDILEAVQEFKADKKEVEQLKKRVDKIEQKFSY